MNLRERVPHLEILAALARMRIDETGSGAIFREAKRQVRIFGSYACFRRHEGRILACYGNRSGYPLGEMILGVVAHRNFIWCECLESVSTAADPTVVVVLVREGEVLLDMDLPASRLEVELRPILDADDTGYPLFVDAAAGRLVGSGYLAGRVEEIHPLSNSPLDELVHRPELQLAPVDQALRRIKVVSPAKRITVFAVATAVLAAVAWLFWPDSGSARIIAQAKERGDPWTDYRKALGSPPPEIVMRTALDFYLRVERAPPRLRLASMTVEDDKLSFSQSARRAPLAVVRNWARDNGFNVVDEMRSPTFEVDLSLPARSAPLQIVPLEGVQGRLEERVEMIFCACQLEFGTVLKGRQWQEQDLRIAFAGPPGLLLVLGEALADLPLRLERLNISHEDIAEDVSGAVQLTLFGS